MLLSITHCLAHFDIIEVGVCFSFTKNIHRKIILCSFPLFKYLSINLVICVNYENIDKYTSCI